MSDALARFFDAINAGRADEVEEMLEATPSLVAAEQEGVSPVLAAVFAGQQGMAEMLLGRGASVDPCAAAALGSVEWLERCVADGDGDAAVNRPGSLGWTPLHLAGFMGRSEAVQWLVARGAEVAAVSRNREANTPLHASLAGKGDPDVIRRLLESGADPDARAALGVTPLHLAASRGDREAVGLLVAAGATPEPMEDGRLPSALARERGHPELAATLEGLEAGSA